ncbi:MAG: 50S ribosomal protein L10 [Ardenticatenaceae bacterium]|nr:50S ribosomal protein L10 [Ardenticatenaceae bacterium]MCB9446256.1 50S ribosomal protein L10 [Ardenticatenaceae bacterium]
MAISKARKDELVAQYGELIGQSKAIFMADYTGMSVKSMEALRHKVREADGAFHVTKKTLLKYALEQADRPVPEELMDGQLAAGFAMDQVPTLAKALVDFAKSEEKLTLRGGIYGNNVLSYDQVKALAELPSLPELRSQLLGLINTPAQNIVSVVAGGIRQVINVIDAYAKSEESAEAA